MIAKLSKRADAALHAVSELDQVACAVSGMARVLENGPPMDGRAVAALLDSIAASVWLYTDPVTEGEQPGSFLRVVT